MDQELRLSLETKLNAIDDELTSTVKNELLPNDDISLSSGVAGLCLYFMTRYQQTGREEFYETATALLNKLLDDAGDHKGNSYCQGAAGVGWLIQYGFNTGFFDGDPNELLADYDDYFMELMNSQFEKGIYDFFHGAMGFAYYFLSRGSLPNQKEVLTNIVNSLSKIAVHEGSLSKWYYYDFDSSRQRSGICNMGLAHGIPGIITFLSMVNKGGFEKDISRNLIRGACNFMLSSKLQKKNSFFSAYKDENNPTNDGSRLGWCYGDVSVAVGFWHAANVLKSEELKQNSFDLLDHSMSRKSREDTEIFDAGFCHGAAGLAFMYDWFYKKSGYEPCREATQFWLSESLKMASFSDGLVGFKAYKAKSGWVKEHGLLEGIAGIGLTYASVLSKSQQNWGSWVLLD